MSDTGASGAESEVDDDTAVATSIPSNRNERVDGTRVDLHVKILNERVVDRAKSRGLDVLVYAPHFTRLPEIRARAARFSDDELLVVPAREVFTGTWRNRRHLLALGLSDPVPDFISLSGALDAFERQGAAVLVPHPLFLNVSLDADGIRRHRGRIHAVETYNLKLFERQNRRGRRLARAIDRPGFGSSYAHLHGSVGEVWTAFEREVDSEAALVAALRETEPRTVFRRTDAKHTLRQLAEFAHLGYENTWGKLDRVLLSGTEPTHPDHVAYGGRFDDVSVY